MSWLKRLFGKASPGHQPEAGPEPIEKSKPELRLSVSDDPLYRDAASFVMSSGSCSVSALQRHLKVGYNRAATLIECLENDLVISPMTSGGSRHVFTDTERQAASLLPSKAELEQKRIDGETALRLSYLLEKYGDTQLVLRIMSGTIWQTMTSEHLYDSVGQPEAVDQKYLKSKSREVWKYDHLGANRYGLRVTLENGTVVGWDSKS